MANKNPEADYIDSSSSDSEENEELAQLKSGELIDNIKSILKTGKAAEEGQSENKKNKTKLVRKEVKFIGKRVWA